ncbi:hypothetical protein KHQ81_07205 [Mycoplasmatota bacterium]|nr:hypothetical protein KHQ81_07205 [Mycoplasmatota bacterium]
MREDWQPVLMLVYIFVFMFFAKIIKEKLGIFKSIVIPTALLAGFLGLIFGPELLGSLSVNLFDQEIRLGLQYDNDFYESILFYFMIIGFVSLTLTERHSKQNRQSIDSGLFIVSTYILQGLLGVFVLYIVATTIKPDIFIGLGLLLPLAFGQGPGLASSIGGKWDETLAIGYAQQFGITLATVGFIVGGIIGVLLLNYYIRKYKLKVVRLRDLKGIKTKSIDFETINEVNFSDNFLVQVVWLSLIFLLTYLVSLLFYQTMLPLGEIGKTLGGLVLGFSYLFGVFIALGLRGFLRKLETRGHRTKPLIDDYMMHNISSFALNVMITASVMSIKISSIKEYWEILLLVTVVGALGTLIYVTLFGRYVFNENPNHYVITLFGMLTGVAATGLALLRGIDPELETDTADNVVVLGSAIAAPIGIPMMILLSFPVIAYTIPHKGYYNYFMIAGLIGYLTLLIGFLVWRRKYYSKKSNQ